MRTTFLLTAALLAPALALAQASGQRTQPGGAQQGTGVVLLLVPDDYSTIQAAIDAARNGQSVLVYPGTYHETIDFLGKPIAVIGVQGPELTIIDGGQAGSVVTFASGETGSSRLTGFTITNGMAAYGGGVYCSGASPTIVGNVITDNATGGPIGYGGGIFCDDASPVIRNNTIAYNVAYRVLGCGIACTNGSSPRIVNNLITGNTSFLLADGGGIGCSSASNAHIAGNVISFNEGRTGGGVAVYGSDPEIVDNTFQFNTSLMNGGGLYCDADSSPTVTGNAFEDNSALDGGGLHSKAVNLLVENNAFERNTAAASGGAIFVQDASSSSTISHNTISDNSAVLRGGGIVCQTTGAVISDNTLSGNSTEGAGGGLYMNAGDPTVTSNVIAENFAVGDGGGCHFVDADPRIVNNVVHDNQSGSDGGGICLDNSSPTITSNTVSRNLAAGNGGGLACFNSSSPSVSNTIFWDDDAFTGLEIWTDLSGVLTVDHCDVEWGWPGLNLMLPPQFADGANGDFHLTSSSQLIDVGDNSAADLPAQDYEGDDRIIDGDMVLPAVVDMGADEFSN